MATCCICKEEGRAVSKELGVCADCIRNSWAEAKEQIVRAHKISRKFFHLQEEIPRTKDGILCKNCVNRCLLGEGERGFCGVQVNMGGRLSGGLKGNYEWYFDPLPTNCVADWVCAGGTGAGYPKYAYRMGPECGYKNLAVFFNNCNFNCLFCQNWHFRERSLKEPRHEIDELSTIVTADTSCVCFFGGDPTPNMEFALKSARKLVEANNRIMRICFETNGSMDTELLLQAIELALETGGCIKFDLKCWNGNLHRALCGVSNELTFKNFEVAARYIKKRKEPPLLIASTLLIPGYVDEKEVRGISNFLAGIDPDIPYALLAFHPSFFMDDLPYTSRKHLERCLEIAIDAGLRRIHAGNFHLLGNTNY